MLLSLLDLKCRAGFSGTSVIVIFIHSSHFTHLNYFTDRLENEQVGNTDQYRATREVPLPYSSTFQHNDRENDDTDGEDGDSVRSSGGATSRRSLRMRLFEIGRSDGSRQDANLNSSD